MELRQKEKAWTKTYHAYQKTLIEYKHKVEGLERKNNCGCMNQKLKQTIVKTTIQILQMNNMVTTKEFNRLNVKKTKEKKIMEVNELK